MFDKKLIEELLKYDAGVHKVNSLDQSYDFCNKLAQSHYENFPVASLIAPKKKRKYVNAIYCFARLADDVADELELNDKDKIEKLDLLINYLESKEHNNHPVFWALKDTIQIHKIPIETFTKLLNAFKWDSDFKQAENWDKTLIYCEHSANPIGKLVLYVFDEFDSTNEELSNYICTALQLANFWQDFSRDLPNKRFYIPKNILDKHNLSVNDLYSEKIKETEKQKCLDEIISFTQELFAKGESLPSKIKSYRLALELELTINAGKRILMLVKQKKLSIFVSRPEVRKTDFILLGLKSFFRTSILR